MNYSRRERSYGEFNRHSAQNFYALASGGHVEVVREQGPALEAPAPRASLRRPFKGGLSAMGLLRK